MAAPGTTGCRGTGAAAPASAWAPAAPPADHHEGALPPRHLVEATTQLCPLGLAADERRALDEEGRCGGRRLLLPDHLEQAPQPRGPPEPGGGGGPRLP